MQVRMQIAEAYGSLLEGDNSDNPVRRAEVRRWDPPKLEQRRERDVSASKHGFIYEGSPIVADQLGHSFPFDSVVYKPTTTPGARLPSTYLKKTGRRSTIGWARISR